MLLTLRRYNISQRRVSGLTEEVKTPKPATRRHSMPDAELQYYLQQSHAAADPRRVARLPSLVSGVGQRSRPSLEFHWLRTDRGSVPFGCGPNGTPWCVGPSAAAWAGHGVLEPHPAGAEGRRAGLTCGPRTHSPCAQQPGHRAHGRGGMVGTGSCLHPRDGHEVSVPGSILGFCPPPPVCLARQAKSQPQVNPELEQRCRWGAC